MVVQAATTRVECEDPIGMVAELHQAPRKVRQTVERRSFCEQKEPKKPHLLLPLACLLRMDPVWVGYLRRGILANRDFGVAIRRCPEI